MKLEKSPLLEGCGAARKASTKGCESSRPLAPSLLLFRCFLFGRALSVFSERFFNRLRPEKKKNWQKFNKFWPNLGKFAKFWKKTAKNSAIFNENFEIRERCKGVHCVDLGESFPTSIYLQKSASIQPRTS